MGSASSGVHPSFLAKQMRRKLGLPQHLIGEVDSCRVGRDLHVRIRDYADTQPHKFHDNGKLREQPPVCISQSPLAAQPRNGEKGGRLPAIPRS
jgi:hypothetical protein